MANNLSLLHMLDTVVYPVNYHYQLKVIA